MNRQVYKTVKFKEVSTGDLFVHKGLTYEKIDSGGAQIPEFFGNRRCPFGKNIKVKIKVEKGGENG